MHMRSWVATYFFSELIVLHCIASWDFFFFIFLFYPWILSLLNILFICSISVVYEGYIDNSESLPRISTLINCIFKVIKSVLGRLMCCVSVCQDGQWTIYHENVEPALTLVFLQCWSNNVRNRQKNRPLYFSAIFLFNCEENIFTYSIFFRF